MTSEWTMALIGGAVIGIAVSLMLLWNGRVTGISNITYGLIAPTKGELSWKVSFLLGLLSGGALLYFFKPDLLEGSSPTTDNSLIIAGLLVGFGTSLGSGCTSGHGVCGISRLSKRSLVATVLFVFSGMLSVFLLKKWGVLL